MGIIEDLRRIGSITDCSVGLIALCVGESMTTLYFWRFISFTDGTDYAMYFGWLGVLKLNAFYFWAWFPNRSMYCIFLNVCDAANFFYRPIFNFISRSLRLSLYPCWALSDDALFCPGSPKSGPDSVMLPYEAICEFQFLLTFSCDFCTYCSGTGGGGMSGTGESCRAIWGISSGTFPALTVSIERG